MSDTLRTIFALPSLQEFIVICGMLLATYSTRLIGWLVLRRHPVSPRMQRILDAAPCCVMISIAAPAFITTNIVTLVTLAATVVVALKTNLAITIGPSMHSCRPSSEAWETYWRSIRLELRMFEPFFF